MDRRRTNWKEIASRLAPYTYHTPRCEKISEEKCACGLSEKLKLFVDALILEGETPPPYIFHANFPRNKE